MSGKMPTKRTQSTATTTTSKTTPTMPADCPPDVEALGRSSWTLLHSITATYPTNPSPQLQSETRSFLSTFGKLYPCWVCAEDFQRWMQKNTPRVSNRSEFGEWMCEAHNAVNEKLGKETFDCKRWEERWRTGRMAGVTSRSNQEATSGMYDVYDYVYMIVGIICVCKVRTPPVLYS